MSKEVKWSGAQAPKPVYRDGLQSTLTYAIVATKKESDEYAVVAIRRSGSEWSKIKFYPNLEAWSLTEGELKAMGMNSLLSRQHTYNYVRVIGTDSTVEKLLEKLGNTRNVATVTFDQYLEGVKSGADHSLSVEVHPYRGGSAPKSPRAVIAFTPPVEEEVVSTPTAAVTGSRKKPLS